MLTFPCWSLLILATARHLRAQIISSTMLCNRASCRNDSSGTTVFIHTFCFACPHPAFPPLTTTHRVPAHQEQVAVLQLDRPETGRLHPRVRPRPDALRLRRLHARLVQDVPAGARGAAAVHPGEWQQQAVGGQGFEGEAMYPNLSFCMLYCDKMLIRWCERRKGQRLVQGFCAMSLKSKYLI